MSETYKVRMKNKRIDYYLLLVSVLLVSIGLFAVFSSSGYVAEFYYGNSTLYFKKQSLYAFIGIVGMIIGVRIDLTQLRNFSKYALMIITIMLMATSIPALGGVTVNGASSWVIIPIINYTFQPSEFAKILLIIYSSNILCNKKYDQLNFFQKIITILPILGVLGIIVKQPDIGSAGVIIMGIFSVYFVSGLKIGKIFSFLIMLVLAGFISITNNPYQMARITGFMDPFADPRGKGFQLVQSLLAIGSGGVTGKGLGESIQKMFYLPEAHTDFIFSIYAEESGLFGAIFLLFLFFVFAQRGYTIAVKSQDPFAKLLATGITTLIIGQATLNLFVVTGMFPTTGITLPFISSGGTSIITTLFCVGLLLNISRYSIREIETINGKK